MGRAYITRQSADQGYFASSSVAESAIGYDQHKTKAGNYIRNLHAFAISQPALDRRKHGAAHNRNIY